MTVNMSKIILAINSGSSSLKVSIYKTVTTTTNGSDKADISHVADIQINDITSPPQKLNYTRGSTAVAKSDELSEELSTQDDAFKYILQRLISDKDLQDIQTEDDISVTCHRVVHGGDYTEPTEITKDTMHHLKTLTDLAPLHNGPALQIIRSCLDTLPNAKNIACFDSQFHHSVPEHIKTYPIDQMTAQRNGLRKYGFHGISYAFITRSVAHHLQKPEAETNIIACHLGSGASVCAIKGGKSMDTSMGLTPVSGLPGATRSGDIDPCLVFHYASNTGNLSPHSTSDLHITTAEEILNKASGWKALTGTTDFGKITSAAFSASSSASSADGPNPKTAKLAFDLFVNRIASYIGSYYVLLHGSVDALVFAGGIGEKGWQLREAVAREVSCLGFSVDETSSDEGKSQQEGGIGRNRSKHVDEECGGDVVVDIAAEGSKHGVLLVRTDEQYEMMLQASDV